MKKSLARQNRKDRTRQLVVLRIKDSPHGYESQFDDAMAAEHPCISWFKLHRTSDSSYCDLICTCKLLGCFSLCRLPRNR